MLYSNDKRINLTGRCSSKCANTKQCLEIYTEQNLTDMKGERDKSTIIVGDFNTTLRRWQNYFTENQQSYRRTKQHNQPIRLNRQIYNEHANQQQQKTGFFFFKHSQTIHQKQTISWAVKRTSTNSKELKSYRVCSLTVLESNKKTITERQDGLHALGSETTHV